MLENKCQAEFEKWVATHENTIDSFNYPDEALETTWCAAWEACEKIARERLLKSHGFEDVPKDQMDRVFNEITRKIG